MRQEALSQVGVTWGMRQEALSQVGATWAMRQEALSQVGVTWVQRQRQQAQALRPRTTNCMKLCSRRPDTSLW